MNFFGRFFWAVLLLLSASLLACTKAKPEGMPPRSNEQAASVEQAGQQKVDVPGNSHAAVASSIYLPFTPPVSGFSIYKHGVVQEPVLLVVGGIQGDEPGGFSAASLLVTHYKITKGAVWVVPDLNFPSILERSRGNAGDMNRKFAHIQENDPDYATVTAIKKILEAPEIDVVLNLHDGSGFYRPQHEDEMHNPNRWGQCVIIDQAELTGAKYPDLQGFAENVVTDVNTALLTPEHRYYVNNTKTNMGHKAMEKTLSYFVVRAGKAAFGIEASKNFTTEYRAYYHLVIIESFMKRMGMEFVRDFELSPKGVLAALNSNLTVAAFDNKVVLPLDNARPNLRLIPFEKNQAVLAKASRPLLAIVPENDRWRVAYGNRTLTKIEPLLIDFDNSLEVVSLVIDGKEHNVRLGEMVHASEWFQVNTTDSYRVNAIGALKEGQDNEAHIAIHVDDFMPSFSVDKNGKIYRVEIYRGEAFAGMLLVNFGDKPARVEEPLTAGTGQESSLGF